MVTPVAERSKQLRERIGKITTWAMLAVFLPIPLVPLGPTTFDLVLLMVAFMLSAHAFYVNSDNVSNWLAFLACGFAFVRFAFFALLIVLLGDIRQPQLLAFLLPALLSGTNALVALAGLLSSRQQPQREN